MPVLSTCASVSFISPSLPFIRQPLHRSVLQCCHPPSKPLTANNPSTRKISTPPRLSPQSRSEVLRLAGKRCRNRSTAHSLFSRAVRLYPLNGRAWQDWSSLYSKQSPEMSIRILQRGLKYNEQNAYLWQSLAEMYLKKGELEYAKRCCLCGLKYEPLHISLYSSLARIEDRLENIAAVRETYLKAHETGLAGAKLYHAWAKWELDKGNEAKAKELLYLGLKSDNENIYIWHTLGTLSKERCEWIQARKCYQQVLKHGENVVTLQEWAKMEGGRGNIKMARKLFERATKADGGDWRVLQEWSAFELQRGSLTMAKVLVQRAVEGGGDSVVWGLFAKIEMAMEDYGRARALFRKACQVNPNDWLAWDQWSAMEYKLGNREEAEKLLHESFRIRFDAKGAFTVLANSIEDRRT